MEDDNTTKIEGFSAEPVKGPLGDSLRALLGAYVDDYIVIQPGATVMPSYYCNWHSKYYNLTIKPDDVWVVTYPKAGTTWTQEVTWCILKGTDHDEGKLELMKRFPFLEFDSLISPNVELPSSVRPEDPMRYGNSWKIVQKLKSPRLIKSHLPKDLLPKQLWEVKPKIVYVIRDPRDVCVSYYYHCIKLEGYSGDFNQFVELFLGDTITYSPIWAHMLQFWEMRNEDHILFIRYEDMKQDLSAIVRKISSFLGVSISDEAVQKVVEHCTFSTMSKNPAANNETFICVTEEAKKIKFMRKGVVGDWKNHLTKEHLKAFKEWTEKNVKGTDFPYYQDYE